MKKRLTEMRRALWHLRKGGPAQLRLHRRRLQLDSLNGFIKPTAASPRRSAYLLPNYKPARDVRVGVIADSFTSLTFQYEWHQVILTPSGWREVIGGIDLLFVESAWHGNNDAWQYQLVGSNAPSQELQDLVSSCKERGIPTVFWNKEDPFHFEEFLDTARLFDRVYTTEVAKVDEYKQRLGHDRVGVLAFGAQPVIHNPSGRVKEEDLGDVAFAGTYFRHKFPERREQMDILLGGAADAEPKLPHGLEIFPRFKGVDPNYEYPEQFKKNLRSELTYAEMLQAYRSFKTFLNVNSIPTSETMFSRRVYEILACGAAVISAPSPAITNMLGRSVIQVDDRDVARDWVRALSNSPALREELSYEGRMRTLREHTYSHRVDQVLSDLGMTEHLLGKPKVTVMAVTNRPHQIQHVLSQIAQQRGVEMQVLARPNGFRPTDQDRAFARELGLNVHWIDGEDGLTLGGYYNELIEIADGDYIAKIDDDDFYAVDYLLEQATAMRAMGAQIVGKESHFMKINVLGRERHALTYPGREHCYTTFVSGPTIMISRETTQAVRFQNRTRGEDSALLRDVIAVGGKIYSTGHLGFIQNRLGGDHTWDIGDYGILAYSKLLPVAFTRHVDSANN